MESETDRRPLWPMFLLLGLLALIYAIGVFSRAIWYDEAITLQSLAATSFAMPSPGFVEIAELKPFLEGRSTLPQVVAHYITADVHPPLYFIAAYFGTVLGGTELEVVRIVSLLLVLSAVAVYADALRHFGVKLVAAYAAVFGLSFAAVTSAQDARGYAMVLLLTVAAWRMVVAVPDIQRRANRIGAEVLLGVLASGLLYTHYFSVLPVMALMAWHVAGGLLRRDGMALIAPVVCAAIFAPWVPVLLDHLSVRPDQFNGFRGIVEWLKRSALHLGALGLAPTFSEMPGFLDRLARVAVLALAAVGTADVVWRRPDGTAASRLAWSAIVIPAIALIAFAGVSMLLDKWFDTLRYYIFFAPFVLYLTARGTLLIGVGLAKLTRVETLNWFPISLLLVLQLSMVNLGWEANANRGGSYFSTMAEQVYGSGLVESLVIIDTGDGRGTLLSAAHALSTETQAYLLSRDPSDWAKNAQEIASALREKTHVILMFTIERGAFGSDKTELYGPIVEQIEASGFDRADAPPRQMGQNYYARWTR